MLHLRSDASRPTARGANLAMARARLVDTDVGPIDVYETGYAGGDAIILVTHGLGSLESFEELADGLALRFPWRRIITYSRPGRGRSPALGRTAASEDLVAEATIVLPALMRTLDIGRADIVGHSDGAAAAALAACMNPGLIASLVAISPQVFADGQFVRATRDLPEEEWQVGLTGRLGAFHLDGEGAYRRWRGAREALCSNPTAVLDKLDALTSPILLIQGLRDEFGSSAQVSLAASRAAGPVKWVLLQRDGHFPHLDNPGQMLDLIDSHLAKPCARQTGRWSSAGGVAPA
jgi:pimeloyl-ACP methyl ester carboxylesterase